MSTPAPVRLRPTPALALRVAVTVVAALAVLVALGRARTVLHWLVTAAVAALLLDGLVRTLVARRVRRGVAVALVTVGTLAVAGLLTYGAVDAVVAQYALLRDTAPASVADLVRTGPLSGFGERTQLVERTRDLVEQAPSRLFGSPVSAARTAAERLGEVALVVTLTVFMLVAYERFEERLLRLDAAGDSWRWRGIDVGVSNGARSARHVVGRVVALGVLSAVVAQGAGAPAPIVLGLWMAWWRMLPVLGLVVAYAPLLLLLYAERPLGVVVLVALVLAGGEYVASAVLWRGSLEAEPRVPLAFLSAVAFFAGFEMSGVVGAVVAVVLVHLGVGVVQGASAPVVER